MEILLALHQPSEILSCHSMNLIAPSSGHPYSLLEKRTESCWVLQVPLAEENDDKCWMLQGMLAFFNSPEVPIAKSMEGVLYRREFLLNKPINDLMIWEGKRGRQALSDFLGMAH